MKTTFNNPASGQTKAEFKKIGLKSLQSYKTDFKFFMEHGTDKDGANDPEEWEKLNEKLTGGISNFYEYGLSVDYVAAGTFERQREGYLRYQLAWGGPSAEIRFYYSPGSFDPYKIVFVYMDWGSGIGFDVTEEDWAQWLAQFFNEVGTVQSLIEKSEQEA